MTPFQEISRALFKEKININEFSFIVFAYHSPLDVLHGTSERLTDYTFPSVRTAVSFVENEYPDIFYYDIELTDKPADCPLKYTINI